MKRGLCLVLVMLTIAGCSAQMHRYNTNFTVSRKNFVDTVKIDFADNQIYLPVRIEGRTYRFCLDTGASQGLLYYGTHVPIEKVLGNVVSHDANGITDTIRAVQLAPITIGSLNITGYVASVVRRPRKKVKFDGIIGFDIFNKGIGCKIDTKKKIMVLSDIKNYFDNESGHRLPYKLKWFVPYIYISPFMRHVDETLFDTGERRLYVMNKQSFEEHAYKSKQVNEQVEGREKGNFSHGTNGIGKPAEIVFLNLDRVKFGNYSFNSVHTITTQGPSRIGGQIFNYGSIVINPRRKFIAFQPYSEGDSISISNKQFGIAFYEKENKPVIGLIWHKTEGFKKGMRQGDIVIKINDDTIESYEQFTDYKFEDGKQYKFVLHDAKGFNKEITITR